MTLTEKDIDKIAALAKLKPTGPEKKRLLHDLNKVLEFMEIIDELDTSNVAGIFHPAPDSTQLREDTVKPGSGHDKAMQNAPAIKDGLYNVPGVMKSD